MLRVIRYHVENSAVCPKEDIKQPGLRVRVLPSRRPDSVAAIYLLFREEGIVSFRDRESSSLNRNRTLDIGIRGISFLATEVA